MRLYKYKKLAHILSSLSLNIAAKKINNFIKISIIKPINREPKTTLTPHTLSQIYFQHHSPHELEMIKPQLYTVVIKGRSRPKEYLASRKLEEKQYKRILNIKDSNRSFTYASIVGFNKMEDPLDYPGFTYYFRLNKQQVNNTLFGIVSGDPKYDITPSKGLKALKRCLNHWHKYNKLYHSVEDDIVGIIDPRIEVIIPYSVIPEYAILEVEQR